MKRLNEFGHQPVSIDYCREVAPSFFFQSLLLSPPLPQFIFIFALHVEDIESVACLDVGLGSAVRKENLIMTSLCYDWVPDSPLSSSARVLVKEGLPNKTCNHFH